MLQFLANWFKRYFSNEEALIVFFLLLSFSLIIGFFGKILAPVFTAIIIAYLLNGLVTHLVKYHLSEKLAVIGVFTIFIGLLTALTVLILPLSWGQLMKILNEQLPRLLLEGQNALSILEKKFPDYITPSQTTVWVESFKMKITEYAQVLLSYSFSGISNLVEWAIFLVIVPVLVFFMMKDRAMLIAGLVRYLPSDRPVMSQIWQEMDLQIANYVRGKCLEVIVLGLSTYIAFVILGVKYAALLALLVGLSAVIPYIGAVVVTIPVVLLVYFQFGLGSDFLVIMAVFTIIQALDGYVLVPLLFSEAVNLHPIIIMVAVLFFGGMWGLWGVFFAIPLATLIKAIMTAWPKGEKASF